MFTHPNKNIKEAYVAEGMKVAEFGAGAGAHSLPLSRQVGESGAVYAIEIQRDILAKLESAAKEEKFSQLHPILGNVEKPGGSSLATQSVDRVLIFNTLYQLEDKATALSEAKRILKPRGRLVIIDWLDSFGHIGPHPDQVVPKGTAQKLAKAAGFEFDKEFEAGSHHYGLLFKLI